MKTKQEVLQTENEKLRCSLLRANSLINEIFSLQEKTGKERLFERNITIQEWNGLADTINCCYADFTIRLKNNHPKLTDLDIRYCCLIKLHVPTMDISTLMHVKPSTVFMVKYRIYRLKIGAVENLDLDGYLNNF